MRPCHIVEIQTPKRVRLNGLWFGPRRATRVILWIHGLGSSAFSKSKLIDQLVDKETAVLAFNNRGHDTVSSIRQGEKYIPGGMAHEVFKDCVDDIEGALRLIRKSGAREIFIGGSSTGCQKSVYWASKKGRGVGGLILLAPISDYSFTRKMKGYERALKCAKTMIRAHKKHALLPLDVWPYTIDAQRFLSVYAGSGEEEIFTYWDKKQTPKILHSVKTPLLVVLAEKDEYGDRPAKKIQDWFAEHLKIDDEVLIVKNAPHSFSGAEKRVAKAIRSFIRA
jgi:pimeloyl-ACP methyl ester carboxylesterase